MLAYVPGNLATSFAAGETRGHDNDDCRSESEGWEREVHACPEPSGVRAPPVANGRFFVTETSSVPVMSGGLRAPRTPGCEA